MSDNTNKGELLQKIAQLQQERNELAATVEALRKAIIEYDDCDTASQSKKACSDMIARAKATPQQHLRDVRAEAGRAGWVACVDWLVENSSADLFTDSEAEQAREIGDQYAERVNAGEK